MSRRIKTIAAELEAEYPELRIELSKWKSDTDGKVAGTRFLRKGKGRVGTRMRVFYQQPVHNRHRALAAYDAVFGNDAEAMHTHLCYIHGRLPIFEHKAGDTYRHNAEVERWADSYAECKKGHHSLFISESAGICCVCHRAVVVE